MEVVQTIKSIRNEHGAWFEYLGLAVFSMFLAGSLRSFLYFLYANFIRGRKNLRKYGEWAVVTGASDGIGKAYAYELAKSKFKVAIVARSKDKLDALEAKIRADFDGAEVLVIPQDLAKDDAVSNVMEKLEGKEIGLLVNNAGISYEFPEFFHDVDASRLQTLFDLNIRALTLLTHSVLPQMVERKKGAIVNIGSISGDQPSALLAVYASSKTYVEYLSAALQQEYESKGIFVQCVVPGFVSTAISKMKPSLTVPKPEAYAKSAVNTIGHDNRTNGFLWHTVLTSVLGLIPKWLLHSQVFKMHLGIRKRALRKKEKEAKRS